MAVSYTVNGGSFDPSPDGKHIAAILPDVDEQEKPVTNLTIILNFADELQRKAPLGGKPQ